MRIHSDVLTQGDLHQALVSTSLSADGVYIGGVMRHGSRKRAHAFEIALRATDGRDRNGKKRRLPNSGNAGASRDQKAATYDEWGYWLAFLFGLDPSMDATYYASAEDFHAKTSNAYRVETEAIPF